MRILFATNDKYYSKLGRYLYNEPATHVGFEFKLQDGTVIIDSTKPVGKVYTPQHWLSLYRITDSVELRVHEAIEKIWYTAVKDYIVGKPYNMPAYIYMLVRGLLKKCLGIPLPTSNPFYSQDKIVCTQVFKPLRCSFKSRFGVHLLGLDLTTTSPYFLAKLIYEHTKDKDGVIWNGTLCKKDN